jgi:hypothetical protein
MLGKVLSTMPLGGCIFRCKARGLPRMIGDRLRIAGNHRGMYGAVDLLPEDINRLVDRALPQ